MKHNHRGTTRRLLWPMLIAFGGLSLLLAVLGCCSLSAPGFRGKAQENFDGSRFRNKVTTVKRGFTDLLRWQLNRDPGPWREWTAAPPGPPPPRRVGGETIRVTFVNHATVLIQMEGLNILTDPIWSSRASPVSWAGPRRARPPGIRFRDLPPIDLVLISHNHYDHLDLSTLRRLRSRDAPHLVVGLGNGELLKREQLGPVAELGWWGSIEVRPGVRINAVPAQHFSGRGLLDRDSNLWAGYVVQGSGGAIYFAGDTGYGPHFRAIGKRFKLRLAILPIGAFRPRWFMAGVHISPAEAVQAHRDLGAERSLAVHFGTFRLADDGQDEPPQELRQALRAQRISQDEFWILDFGEGRNLP